jgi:hypothetical protein
VASTVKDLVAGGGSPSRTEASTPLKGVPATWRLFAVTP